MVRPASHAIWRAALRRRARRVERAVWLRLRRPDRVRCPVCDWSGVRFAPSYNPRRPGRICPSCGSSERYRALCVWLNRQPAAHPGSILLEVAPIGTLSTSARRCGYRYLSVDLGSPRAMVRGDLTALPFASASIELAVCFHVLEHVPADREAVRELVRILTPTGRALVVVPRDTGREETFEVADLHPSQRERVYGQSDHVRIYGSDLVRRWVGAGVAVAEVMWSDVFTPDACRNFGFGGDDDRFWVLSHPGETPLG